MKLALIFSKYHEEQGEVQSPPTPGQRYLIGLCCGDARIWEFIRVDARSFEWWRDTETGNEFSSAGVMYAWWIIEALPASAL